MKRILMMYALGITGALGACTNANFGGIDAQASDNSLRERLGDDFPPGLSREQVAAILHDAGVREISDQSHDWWADDWYAGVPTGDVLVARPDRAWYVPEGPWGEPRCTLLVFRFEDDRLTRVDVARRGGEEEG